MCLLLLAVVFLWVELGIPWLKISEAVDHFATVINVRTQTAPLNTNGWWLVAQPGVINNIHLAHVEHALSSPIFWLRIP